MSDERPSGFLSRAKQRGSRAWSGLQQRRPSIRHVVRAWKQLQDNDGNYYASALTYLSFLALFPLLLLVAAVTGFVLHAHPAARQSLLDHIATSVPGSLGTTLESSVNTVIDARTGLGIVALIGVLLTGLSWVNSLRRAMDATLGLPPRKANPITGRLNDLMVLAGLGLGVLLSLGLTVVGSALTGHILGALNLGHVPGLHFVVTVVGLLLAAAGDVIVIWWMIARLPSVEIHPRLALRGALLAAVGVEALKLVGTYTIAHTAHSPTAGPFAGLLAVLIWIQLVARFLLFCVSWVATAMQAPDVASDAVARCRGIVARRGCIGRRCCGDLGGVAPRFHERQWVRLKRHNIAPTATTKIATAISWISMRRLSCGLAPSARCGRKASAAFDCAGVLIAGDGGA
jgi:membrane protein